MLSSVIEENSIILITVFINEYQKIFQLYRMLQLLHSQVTKPMLTSIQTLAQQSSHDMRKCYLLNRVALHEKVKRVYRRDLSVS